MGTVGPTVILGEAVWAAGGGPGPSCECIVVELGVRGIPVQVSSDQHFRLKLTVKATQFDRL